MMCRPAFEYEDSKQELHQRVVDNMTVFLYVYSGLEALINDSNFKNCKKNRGKINAAKLHIKSNFSNGFLSIPMYRESLNLLFSFIDQKDSDYQNLKTSFTLDDCCDFNGIGLKVVYKIRNLLAHGSFSFPEPLGHSYMMPLQSEIIEVSTRIILLSAQMIMIGNCEKQFKKIDLYNSEVIDRNDGVDEEWEVDELIFLRSLHIQKQLKDPNQYCLVLTK